MVRVLRLGSLHPPFGDKDQKPECGSREHKTSIESFTQAAVVCRSLLWEPWSDGKLGRAEAASTLASEPSGEARWENRETVKCWPGPPSDGPLPC
jgi:hypothetical protein